MTETYRKRARGPSRLSVPAQRPVFGSRLLPTGTLRGRPGILLLVALRGLLGATVVAADVYLPLYLQSERGSSPSAAGLVVSVGAVGWLGGTWLQGRRGDTPQDNRVLLLAAGVLVLCGPAGTLLHTLDLVPIPFVVIGCILMGAGASIAYPRLTSTVLALSSAAQYGANSASLQAAGSMASAGFLALTGALMGAVGGLPGYQTTSLLVLGVGAAAAAAACRPLLASRVSSHTGSVA